ncbi:hypothetical protein [Martelella sp. FOR1707]
MLDERKCRMCGCTDISACLHADGTPCCWVEDDFCSACDEKIDPVRVALDELACLTGEAGLKALLSVIEERVRQVEKEGWTPEHDDRHDPGELAAAAGCYALHAYDDFRLTGSPAWWPFEDSWYKPTTPIRDLVKSSALDLAALEVEFRAQAKGGAA